MPDDSRYRSDPDLLDKIKELETRISRVERARQLGNAAIDKGDLTVLGGGSLIIVHPNGTPIAVVGKNVVDGLEQWGVATYRPDSSVAMVSTSTEAGESTFSIRDKNGDPVFQVDDDFGISIPQMLYGLTKTADIATPPVTTTSGTFTALWTAHGIVQSPRIKIRFLIQNPGGTTSEVRLTDPTLGITLAGPQAYGSGFFNYDNIVGPLQFEGYADDRFKVDLEVRRASGAGTVATLAVYAASA